MREAVISPVVGQLRTLARHVLPLPIRTAWGRISGPAKVRRARRAFEAAQRGDGAFLPRVVLSALMQRGYAPPDRVRYDADGLVARADDKILGLQRSSI